jgi:hypothetical protein
MSPAYAGLISACIVERLLNDSKTSNNTPSIVTCSWCGKISPNTLCIRCGIIEAHAKELGRQVALLTEKGGCQLYIGIERTGQKTELLSVKRWSPLEPLENVDSVEQPLSTYQ